MAWWKLIPGFAVLCTACGGRGANVESERSTSFDPGFPVRETVIRVINQSDRVLSRSQPCASDYQIAIRPRDFARVLPPTSCPAVSCDSIGPSETVEPSSCAVPGCAGGRVDIAPGSADVDYRWDGIYAEPTERNCFEPIPLDVGDVMLASICFGRPGAERFAIEDLACGSYEFDYGIEVFELGMN
jgi:hypothetical protein